MSKEDEQWITTGQSVSWDEEDVLIGQYIRLKTDVGAHSSNVYVIRRDDGSEVGVWGSTVINGRFSEIPMRSKISIEALGETKSKNGTTYKDYLIKYIPPKNYIETRNTFGGGEPLPDAPVDFPEN